MVLVIITLNQRHVHFISSDNKAVYFLSSYVHKQQSSAGKDTDLLVSIKNNSNISSAFKISFLLYLFPRAPLLIFCVFIFNHGKGFGVSI